MRTELSLFAVALLCAVGGCKRHSSATGDRAAAPRQATAAPLLPVGSPDPFSWPKGDYSKLWQSGYGELSHQRFQPAAAAMQNVVSAAPEFTPARFVLIRALAALHRFDEIPAQFEQLIARDWVGYAHRLDRSKEFAALRASPVWPQLTALAARYQKPYAQGLDRGFFFVVRLRPASEPQFAPGVTDAPLSLRQEVFHYDPDNQRFRRITDTSGHAFAINVAVNGKSLYFLAATKLHRENGLDSFDDPRLGVVDLASLTTTGPFVEKGRYDQVGLGSNRLGQPMFTFVATGGGTAAFTIDTAGTGLAPLGGDGVIPAGGETRAWPNQVVHFEDEAVPGVKIEDGATQFLIDGVGTPVVAARPIAQSSLTWSPSKSRLTYAGKLDACKILKGESKEKNELYVYDKVRRSAQRIAAAVSEFETLWLGDDRLVYEGGVGKAGKIHLYTFSTHADETLPTRYGAGLYGVPTLACEQAETGIDQELGADEDEGD